MIIIVHRHNKVTQILDANKQIVDDASKGKPITKSLKILSEKFPKELIIWCHENYLDDLNTDTMSSVFHHARVMASFSPSNTTFLPKQIGYVERSFFLKINKKVTYPSWLMHSCVGGINAEVINNLKADFNFNENFNYFLNSLAKRGMVEGLFCYSEPNLLLANTPSKVHIAQASTYQLFKFVKQHYKWVWVFFLSAAYIIFENKLKVLPLIKSFFYKKLNTDFTLENITVQSTKNEVEKREIDIVIPTIGRTQYLYDVLKDFAHQTLLPKRIIIVEQNPDTTAFSELHAIKTEIWPFKIKHIFTHKTGVCNARNTGLQHTESEWIFLGDDDNRFESGLLENLFKNIEKFGATVGTTVYLQPSETQTYFKTAQTSIFGAGNSIVKSSVLKQVKFNTNYEFNYGEDTDFGMQLRNLGHDVMYFADIKITHLKAPIGGYRTKVKQPWADAKPQPKPSPTIQLLYQSYFTQEQLLGYKLLLGLRSYKNGRLKHPFKFIKKYKKQWQQSEYWCEKLISRN